MHDDWKQNPDAETDRWDRRFAGAVHCLVTQYAGSADYCWQTVRGNYRIYGIARGRDSAMQRAEETMALPIDEFNQVVAAELVDKLREIERDLLRLSPTAAIIPGYHAGYEAGVADVKRRIAAAIDLEETTPAELEPT